MDTREFTIVGSYGLASITVKFIGPTNYRSSRYKATCQAGTITMPADYSLDATGNAKKVAMALAKKVDWQGVYHMGYLPESEKSYWVFVLEVPK